MEEREFVIDVEEIIIRKKKIKRIRNGKEIHYERAIITKNNGTKMFVYSDCVIKMFDNDNNESKYEFDREKTSIMLIKKYNLTKYLVKSSVIDDYIIKMDRWHGDVIDLFNKGGLNVIQFKDCIHFVIEALTSMINNNMYYTDIKLDNILYRKTGDKLTFCLGDMGSLCYDFNDNGKKYKTGGCTYPSGMKSILRQTNDKKLQILVALQILVERVSKIYRNVGWIKNIQPFNVMFNDILGGIKKDMTFEKFKSEFDEYYNSNTINVIKKRKLKLRF
tara:strand:- start:60 stop:887 length:828 start_codon:yes stop_codon:yes gene_type:complete